MYLGPLGQNYRHPHRDAYDSLEAAATFLGYDHVAHRDAFDFYRYGYVSQYRAVFGPAVRWF